jgi:hypothetical protein
MIEKRIKEIRDYVFAKGEGFPMEHRIFFIYNYRWGID